MSSWRPLVAGTVGVFVIVLAFLAGQLKGGGDPGLRQNAAASQPAPRATPGQQDDLGTAPAVPNPDLAPPTTHQS
jgi:hypothetical protein